MNKEKLSANLKKILEAKKVTEAEEEAKKEEAPEVPTVEEPKEAEKAPETPEDITPEQAEKVVDAVEKETTSTTADKKIQAADYLDESEDAVQMLDLALETAENERIEKPNGGQRYLNLCFIGRPGTGKTTVLYKWANARGVNVYQVDAQSLDKADFKGKRIDTSDGAAKFSAVRNDEWDKFRTGKWVLFFDEYEKVSDETRGLLLTLIADHRVPNPEKEGGTEFLPGILFVVVGGNPAGSGNNIKHQFMESEKTRWETVTFTSNRARFWRIIRADLQQRIQNNPNPEWRARRAMQLQIAYKLLSDTRFHFTTEEESEMNADTRDSSTTQRSLHTAILTCRDLQSFYKRFEGQCNPLQLETVKAILGNFTVNDDEANKVLKAFDSRTAKIFKEE